MTHQQAARPGGRSSRVLTAIYEAVGQLVGEGAERITFPVVAERAGVNPTTLYRRWGNVSALLEDVAVAALTQDGESLPDTGSLARDLTEWANVIARDITRPERVRYLRAMVGARVDIVSHCAVTEARREQAAEMVGRPGYAGKRHRRSSRSSTTSSLRSITTWCSRWESTTSTRPGWSATCWPWLPTQVDDAHAFSLPRQRAVRHVL